MNYHFHRSHLAKESDCIRNLLSVLDWDDECVRRVGKSAAEIILSLRAAKADAMDIETFLTHYPLSSPEGLALISLAEAALRIPDADTANLLIAEKMATGAWSGTDAGNATFKVAGFGLELARKTLGSAVGSFAKPVIRKAVTETIRQLGKQFVIGAHISTALAAAKDEKARGYRVSFDMLGEGARTPSDAERYFAAYREAIINVGGQQKNNEPTWSRHGISVKLSALHPRYHWTQRDRCVPEIAERLSSLCRLARDANITLTVDAEESDRLEMSLDILSQVSADPSLTGWNGLGLAIQAYDKRCYDLIDDLYDMARRDARILQVRLVKGAYWDSEIKRAQMAGWPNYAVFTRKHHTDLSYLACAYKLLKHTDALYPMFATHNGTTAAAILDMSRNIPTAKFEFQRLFGMGKALGDFLRTQKQTPVTIYGPVGEYSDLLPYLVRRMLENGASTSFVARIRDTNTSLETLTVDAVQRARLMPDTQGESLPLPLDIYGPSRRNACGYDLSLTSVCRSFLSQIHLPPDIDMASNSPAAAITKGIKGFGDLQKTTAAQRAVWLERLADILESRTKNLLALLQDEGKKTLADAIAEIREAVDFCRYYAQQGRNIFCEDGISLVGPTGENNRLRHRGRGVFLCISPWNFPLAIYLGQISAALMAGNSVIAKPAEQTPRIAAYTWGLMMEAGIPISAVTLCLGDGTIGAELTRHPDIAGVAFTGSTAVAHLINRTLAEKEGPIVPLIAETGGQNAMIVDSSALPEQVLDDVLLSAFGSTGQRCSALRVLFLQDDVADRILDLLRGAVPLLRVGAPENITTDVGPVIDEEALMNLRAHQRHLDSFAKKIVEAPIPEGLSGTYFPPMVYEIDSIHCLRTEVFGPILHVIRYAASTYEDILKDINSTGFGLTFGLHSRIENRFSPISDIITAGNIYINRSIIGATVGVQPFGGRGLSGTGPKAGGPHYLIRFATEQVISINTTATGGNIDLVMGIAD